MPTRDSIVLPQAVLAVLVVFERDLNQVTPWPALCAWMSAEVSSGMLALKRVLIYDNSVQPRVQAKHLPAWACHVHDPANGGTAAAYTRALREAQSAGIPWLLLLDHDTRLPHDLLEQAGASMRRIGAGKPGPAAWLPRVCQADRPLSPARITSSGSIRPLTLREQPGAADVLTAIASGALVRTQAFAELGPIPHGLWLDYVDHWLFRGLQRRGYTLAVFDALLDHDLSLTQADRLSRRRLKSILRGEEIFTRTLAWPARRVRPLRVLWRALRPSALRFAQRADIVGYVLRGLVSRRR